MKPNSNTQFYTYLHCRPDGTPFYVGKGKDDRANLFNTRSVHHKNIVAKYGKETIDIFIFPRTSEQDALDTEIRWIAQLKREGIKLCNQTNGGDGMSGYVMPPEVRAKLSATHTGKTMPPQSAAHRAKLSAARTGKKQSPESIEKIRGSKIGKKASLEARANMSAARIGMKRSPETCANISAAKLLYYTNKRLACLNGTPIQMDDCKISKPLVGI